MIKKELEIKFDVVMAVKKDRYRKPATGMLEFYIEKKGYTGNISDIKYIGDAAGRPRDHSCDDRKYAYNTGMRFETPEKYFLDHDDTTWDWNCGKPYFDPVDYINKTLTMPKIEHSSFEMVILVASPASGKSTFAKEYYPNYVYVNQDTLGTRKKCLKLTEESLKNKKSVIIDNTNPSNVERKEFIELANKYNAKVKIIEMLTDALLSKHLDAYRAKTTDKQMLPDVVFNVFKKRYVKPTTDECSEILTIPFIPKLTEDEKKIFLQLT